jgi:hypothetical protein
MAHTQKCEETRIWHKRDGRWLNVHLHRYNRQCDKIITVFHIIRLDISDQPSGSITASLFGLRHGLIS